MRAMASQLVFSPQHPGVRTERTDTCSGEDRMVDIDGPVDDGDHDLGRPAAGILAQLPQPRDEPQVAVRVHDRPAARDTRNWSSIR